MEINQALPRHSMRSSTHGMGKLSYSDNWFSFLKSLQRQSLLLGLETIMMGLDQGLLDFLIIPSWSMRATSASVA